MDALDFSTLYRRYAADVHRFAFWLIGHKADAEDVTAETFARAFAGADGLRMGSAKAYLLTIARHLCAERARRARPQSDVLDALIDPGHGPEAHAALGSDLRRTLAALGQLHETERAALLLHAHEGLEYSQIAQALGLSLAAVKVRIHRARLRLETLLEESQ